MHGYITSSGSLLCHGILAVSVYDHLTHMFCILICPRDETRLSQARLSRAELSPKTMRVRLDAETRQADPI
jgi:hypothetical protein